METLGSLFCIAQAAKSMALQFYAVHSVALAHTHDALRALAERLGRTPPGPTRALRVAQLYGHLQLRANGRERFVLPLCELAASWRLQPRQLRQDLALLAQLGWLSALGTTHGTEITLHPVPTPQALQADPPPTSPMVVAVADSSAPASGTETPRPAGTDQPGEPGQRANRGDAADPAAPASGVAPFDPVDPASGVERVDRADTELLARLAALYNQHRPPSWPAYHPRGQGLRTKVRQALKQAGGPEELAATFIAALNAMPPFWRTTYPQGRSGAECMAVLFATDRGCAGLGVEFWHLFSWAQAGRHGGSGTATGAVGGGSAGSALASGWAGSALAVDGASVHPCQPEDPLQRARRLFLWDSGLWRGQGREALLLSPQEKLELTLLLEANGGGLAGTAARQFAPPEELEQATQAPVCGAGEAQVWGRGEGAASVPDAPIGASGDPINPSSRPPQHGSPPDGGSLRKRKGPQHNPVAALGAEAQPDANPPNKHPQIKSNPKRLQMVQSKSRPGTSLSKPLPTQPPTFSAVPTAAARPPGDPIRRRSAALHLQGAPPAVDARAG
jgi:hypothetical protein